MHGAEAVKGSLAEGLDLFESGNVGLDADGVGAVGPQLGRDLIKRPLFDVGDHQIHAPGSEAAGDTTADPTGAVGNYGSLSRNVHYLPLPAIRPWRLFGDSMTDLGDDRHGGHPSSPPGSAGRTLRPEY